MERLIEPLPRGLNRLAAPLFVFIFGMFLPLITLPQQVMEPFHTLNLKSTCLHRYIAGAVRSLKSVFLSGTNHHHHLTAFHFRELFYLPQFR